MSVGIMNKAYKNMKNRKDTTPTLDAQVVDLPDENKNEKEIVIQRPDNDDDTNVNLPATSSGNNLVPPDNSPSLNLEALNGGELAPIGDRDLAEDVEFTIDKPNPEGIEGYKQAGESWHTSTEEEQPKIEEEEKLAIEDKTENDTEEENKEEPASDNEKPEYEDLGTWRDPEPEDDDDRYRRRPYRRKDDEEDVKGSGLSDILNSGATDFSINDIVESEQEIPHYQYRSLLNRR